MKIKLTFLLLLILIANVQIASAQEKQLIKVALSVSSKSKELQKKITSFISRELRDLRDIEIKPEIVGIYDEIDFTIEILAIETNYGFAISYVVLPLAAGGFAIDHQLFIGGTDEDLRKICTDLIVNFDTNDRVNRVRKSKLKTKRQDK